MNIRKNKLHILIIVGVVALLAIMALRMIGSLEQQFTEDRDTRRENHLGFLRRSFLYYQLEHKGAFPGIDIPSEFTEICNTERVEAEDCGNLADVFILSLYHLFYLPIDPYGGIAEHGIGYKIALTEESIIFNAPRAETRNIFVEIKR